MKFRTISGNNLRFCPLKTHNFNSLSHIPYVFLIRSARPNSVSQSRKCTPPSLAANLHVHHSLFRFPLFSTSIFSKNTLPNFSIVVLNIVRTMRIDTTNVVPFFMFSLAHIWYCIFPKQLPLSLFLTRTHENMTFTISYSRGERKTV